ncbi:type II toxin-antitoxin system death-on-curing family toxin [Consotaella aegiceratis]|uniref:type II toxin-antitoxin system death-on-curing family toxin n=1 Tax=Consotaella aegiceratis TaxID=3097961 RepID=UPI002F3ECBBB
MSALARPNNLYAFDLQADLFDCAASLAFGIAKNHPFVDGNKRTSLVASITFLEINGYVVEIPEPIATPLWNGLADGTVTERQLAGVLRAFWTDAPI